MEGAPKRPASSSLPDLTGSSDESHKDHPIAPTEFLKRRSAVEMLGPKRPPHPATYTSQEEDTVRQSRLKAGTNLGLPPSALRVMIAIGQTSTDPIIAC